MKKFPPLFLISKAMQLIHNVCGWNIIDDRSSDIYTIQRFLSHPRFPHDILKQYVALLVLAIKTKYCDSLINENLAPKMGKYPHLLIFWIRMCKTKLHVLSKQYPKFDDCDKCDVWWWDNIGIWQHISTNHWESCREEKTRCKKDYIKGVIAK